MRVCLCGHLALTVTPHCHSHNTVSHDMTMLGVSQKVCLYAGSDGVEEHLIYLRIDGCRSVVNFVVFVSTEVLVRPTVFWWCFVDTCSWQVSFKISLHNRLFMSAFVCWNINMYPSYTRLNKCPSRPTVSRVSSCPIPILKSSYQACQLFLKRGWISATLSPELSFLVNFLWETAKIVCSQGFEVWFVVTHLNHCSYFEDWSCFRPRLNSCRENWACKI